MDRIQKSFKQQTKYTYTYILSSKNLLVNRIECLINFVVNNSCWPHIQMSASVLRHGEIHHRKVCQQEQETFLFLRHFVVILLTSQCLVKT